MQAERTFAEGVVRSLSPHNCLSVDRSIVEVCPAIIIHLVHFIETKTDNKRLKTNCVFSPSIKPRYVNET